MGNNAIARLLAVAVIAGSASPPPAHALDGAGVNLTVPSFCEIQSTSIVVAPGQSSSLGLVEENCNSQEAFIIVANHRPLDTSELVTITYDGQSTSLSPSGMTAVATRTGMQSGVAVVMISETGLTAPLEVTFSITSI